MNEKNNKLTNNTKFSGGFLAFAFAFSASIIFLFVFLLHISGVFEWILIISAAASLVFAAFAVISFFLAKRNKIQKGNLLSKNANIPPPSEKEVESAWNRFLENSPIAIALMEENGLITESNSAFRELTGRNQSDRSGYNAFDLIEDENKTELLKLIKDDNISGINAIDVKFKNNNGKSASLYVNPASSKESGTASYIAYLIDTTEQKNLEVSFVHSQKMQAVGQLAGGIAHDFNNLLTAMIGFCDLLLIRHPPGEQSFADIMQIKQNANRASNLVRQLLAFSRRQTLNPKVTDVTDTLAELSNLIRRLIGENIELKMRHGRDIWKVRVDQGQLEQVIINLAVNARDSMPEGGVLTIRTHNTLIDKNHQLDEGMISSPQDEEIQEGEYVAIEIQDTGQGIPPDIITKIFEPFFTTKKVGEGTGLGLSTVYGIIQQTGGHIYVSSTIGKGTKFSIFLKHHSEKETMATPFISADLELARDLTGSGTILLVEDEDPVRIFSSRALQNKGYKVLEANSGEAAIELMKKHGDEINAVITDVVMPGMTGPVMIEKMLKEHPDLKVIFVSGYAEDTFVKTYGTKREFNFLAKPFTLNQLAAKVKEVINK